MRAEHPTEDAPPAGAPAAAEQDAGGPEPLRRGGLNPSEAAIAWALVHFGGNLEACQRLEGEVGGLIRGVAEPAVALQEAQRFQLVERWREEDRRWDRLDWLVDGVDPTLVQTRLGPGEARWSRAYELIRLRTRGRRRPWRGARARTRRAVEWLATEVARDLIIPVRPELRAHQGFDLEQLIGLSVAEFTMYARWLGVHQLIELSCRQSRRSVVLLRQQFEVCDHAWFDHCYRRGAQLAEEERARLRLLFNAVGGPKDGLAHYITRVGLYSMAAASVQRFGQKLRYVLSQLPAQCAAELNHQLQCVERAVQVDMTWQLWRQLDEYVRQREEFLITTQPTPAPDYAVGASLARPYPGLRHSKGRT